eukprot:Clim_evm54s215 gene=Clim_evmTU54s215
MVLPCFSVTPRETYIDEDVDITVQNLTVGKKVLLIARISGKRNDNYAGCGVFTVPLAGEIGTAYASSEPDVSFDKNACSLYKNTATYSGVEPMGVFWSMEADRVGNRYHKEDCENPDVYNLEVRYLDRIDTVVCSTAVKRHYISPGIKKEFVRTSNGLRGSMYIPPGPGPFPALIDLKGSVGGLNDRQAAIMSTFGFMVFHLAFFRYDDLPEIMNDVSVEYFDKAVQWMYKHPMTSPKQFGGGIGIVGLSRGASHALWMATRNPDLVSTVVLLSGSNVNVTPPSLLNGKPFPCAEYDYTKAEMRDGDVMIFTPALADSVSPKNPEFEKIAFPIENLKAAVLLCAAEDDECWDSAKMNDYLVTRARQHNYKFPLRSITYPEAGHIIDIPNYPGHGCTNSYHSVAKAMMGFGGTAKANQVAATHSFQTYMRWVQDHMHWHRARTPLTPANVQSTHRGSSGQGTGHSRL